MPSVAERTALAAAEITRLGAGAVSTEPGLVAEVSSDWSRMSPVLQEKIPPGHYLADVVVRPTEPEQVPVILKVAFDHDVPVTPRGAGTGNYGQATPFDGGILLDLRDLRSITVNDGGRLITYGGDAATPYIHTYGVTGILVDVEIRTDPARDRSALYADFATYDALVAVHRTLLDLPVLPRLASGDEPALVPTLPAPMELDATRFSLRDRGVLDVGGDPVPRPRCRRPGRRGPRGLRRDGQALRDVLQPSRLLPAAGAPGAQLVPHGDRGDRPLGRPERRPRDLRRSRVPARAGSAELGSRSCPTSISPAPAPPAG